MCTYVTEVTSAAGSAKGPAGWFRLSNANVSFDHPYHAPYDHTLNIDFINTDDGPSQRVAVELSVESARNLVAAIEKTLASAPHLADQGES